MKNIFFCLFMLASSISFGQKLTLNELIKLSKCNDDDFDTYVTTKGYKFWKTEVENSYSSPATIINYAYNQNGSDQRASYFVMKLNFENGVCQASFQTSYKVDYLSIKNQLKSGGYIFDKSSNDENGANYLTYHKGKIRVGLISLQGANAYDELITGYKVVVWVIK